MPVKVFDQEAFHEVDRQVRGMAFDIHNTFGRYLDESIYQLELARRLRVAGRDVVTEFRMTACMDGFFKNYFADLLIDAGVIVETKTVRTMTSYHRGQTLNYLYMCGLRHATQLNFRPQRVEHEFVSTGITFAERQNFEVHAETWTPCSEQCESLRKQFLRCLSEWGAFLDPNLYRDALVHYFGGLSSVERNVPVTSEGVLLGTQKMRMINDRIAFTVTASTHRPDTVFDHQRRFLQHTPLKALHWFNLNRHNIEIRTITQ